MIIDHCTYDSFDGIIFSIHTLNSQNVVAKIECFEFALLAKQDNHNATRPMQSFTEQFSAKWNNPQMRLLVSCENRLHMYTYSTVYSPAPTGIQ